MSIQTRTITATISELNGPRLPGARVVIELKGLGNSPQGAVAPGRIELVTDADGVATFQLWQNSMEYSDTYYEISSWHPISGKPIHQREPFFVFDSDADVKDLINVAAQSFDPNQVLMNQVVAARAAAEAAALRAHADAGVAKEARGVAVDALDRSAHIVSLIPQMETIQRNVENKAEQVRSNTAATEASKSSAQNSERKAIEAAEAAERFASKSTVASEPSPVLRLQAS